MKRAAGTLIAALALGAAGTACTPDVARDPTPEAMQFDPESVPPRVPQPTALVVNGQTGHIDFSLANITIPADCSAPPEGLSQAECEFDQYLQTLNGFPTVTPAQAPATAALDPATLTLGTNVVVAAARSRALISDVTVGFDGGSRSLTVRPRRSWTLGELYWVGVRGYGGGVRAENGSEVVGSPTQYLLKQETSLTCGAADADQVDPHCPAVALLGQTHPDPADAARTALRLEAVRLSYLAGGGWDLMAAAGLPKSEIAVLWAFPIHSFSVAELDPSVGVLPIPAAADEIRVAVQGTVDPATVTPFVFTVQYGSVVLMDLTAAQGPNAREGFPDIDATYVAGAGPGGGGGAIVMKGRAPFVPGHQYGIFMSRAIHDASGNPLVPSPVSVLLRLRGTLLDGDGHSTISTISDQDATALEAGRAQLVTLFDGQFTGVTHMTRDDLVYCFAFAFPVAP